jgi:aspartyl-tRNA(Asn)/glutamyl-tRNA(Gln) amidotransferase subunit A
VKGRSARETRDAVLARQISAEETTREAIARADSLNPRLNTFLQIFTGQALAAAAKVDARIAAGERPPLAGVPVAIKDNMCLASADYPGARTTAASRILESYESPYTATAVQRLIDAGAVIIGKTNLDEFAMGSSGENSAFGPARNPWDTSRVPGGSSSGSAAAVAAGIVPLALGSDTGGSIRQPAGLCGIVGLKPTYGRISRYGLIAFASSLDQIGPMTRSVEDAALALSVMSGLDPHDATSAARTPDDFGAGLARDVQGAVIGVPRQAFDTANHPAVRESLNRAIRALTEVGARTVEVDLPHAGHGIAAYYLVATAEASSNLARFDGIRYGRRAALRPGETLEDLYSRSRAEGFGQEVQRRIMLGTYALSAGYYDAYYLTALKVRRRIKQDFDAAFDPGGDGAGCDALLMPASPEPAWKLGEKSADPLSMYLADIYTVGANLAGLPGITIPAGLAEVSSGGAKLPCGVQLIAPAWGEAKVLALAAMLERRLGLFPTGPAA